MGRSLSNLGSNMFGSQQTMASFIGTAKAQFPKILQRSMHNTKNLIRKDILKLIKKVIKSKSNQDKIKEIIINKVHEIIDNEKPITIEGTIVDNENNKGPPS
jgi:hypothetical protein